jgi:hypothetical protein
MSKKPVSAGISYIGAARRCFGAVVVKVNGIEKKKRKGIIVTGCAYAKNKKPRVVLDHDA